MPQVVQFPMQQQTIPVQVPISTGNGQTIYQTVHVPIQSFGNQMPQIIQPQMQIIPQYTQQVANIITPNGQIQQVQLGPMLQQPQGGQQQTITGMPGQAMKIEGSGGQSGQDMNQQNQPITITNAQGQQMTVIPAQHLRSNQNIIQIPNIPGIQSIPVQHIPGIGNVQVIPASALNGNFMSPMQTQTIQQIPQQIPTSPQQQQQHQLHQQQQQQQATPVASQPPQQQQTITITPQAMQALKSPEPVELNNSGNQKWFVKQEIIQPTPIVINTSSASTQPSQQQSVATISQSQPQTVQSILPASIATLTQITASPVTQKIQTSSSGTTQVTIQPAISISQRSTPQPATSSSATMVSSLAPASTSNTTATTTQIIATPATVTLHPAANSTSVNVNINVGTSSVESSLLTPDVKPRVRRVACTCPNCTNGDRHSDRKKQHICHVPGCNKVYGKTSHLRAHLRWHTGKNKNKLITIYR